MKRESIAIIQQIISAVLLSTAGIFIKLVPWNSLTISSVRSLIAGIILLFYIYIRKYKFVITKKTILAGILTCATYITFVAANKLTTSANAIVLQYTSPVFIVIFPVWLLKTRMKKADIIAVALTMCGIILFFIDELKMGFILGNIIAIISGMFIAGMYVMVGTFEINDRLSGLVLGQIFTFLVGMPSVLTSKPVMNLTSVSCILALGIFQLGLSCIFFVHATQYCPPLACNLVGVVEPLLNPFWVFLFDGEKIGGFALVGGAIVIITVTSWCVLNRGKD